jgi:Trk-type K+ transport system membrane component
MRRVIRYWFDDGHHSATTFSGIPAAGKRIIAFCTLIGRLEIYTLLVPLFPEFREK